MDDQTFQNVLNGELVARERDRAQGQARMSYLGE